MDDIYWPALTVVSTLPPLSSAHATPDCQLRFPVECWRGEGENVVFLGICTWVSLAEMEKPQKPLMPSEMTEPHACTVSSADKHSDERLAEMHDTATVTAAARKTSMYLNFFTVGKFKRIFSKHKQYF